MGRQVGYLSFCRRSRIRARSKEKSNFIHAREAALTRYGIDYSRQVESEVIGEIRNGKSDGVRVSHTRSMHTLSLRGRLVRVVYDRARESVITFLPLERAKGSEDGMRSPAPPQASGGARSTE